MQFYISSKFKKQYKKLPLKIQKIADKQILQLTSNLRQSSSLNLKKVQGQSDIWEIRITKEYRATLQRKGTVCIMRKIGTHDILKKP